MSHNFYVVDRASGSPLSALEFRDAVLGRRGPVEIRRIGPGRFPYIFEDKLMAYYRRGADEWFLWWGNNVFTYDQDSLIAIASRLPRTIEQAVALLSNQYPKIHILKTTENAQAFDKIRKLHGRLASIAGIFIFLLIILLGQFYLRSRLNRQSHVR